MYALKIKQPKRRSLARKVANLAEFEGLARDFLPPAIYHYVTGASEDEVTHQRNRDAFHSRAFFPKVLVDVSERSAATSLFGVRYALPFGIAPMGFTRLIAPDGDIELASVASDANIPFILSGASLTRMEEIQEAGTSSWFQAYLPGEEDRILALADRVEAAGFCTLVLTADTAVNGSHERAARNGFVAPIRLNDFNLAWQCLSRPSWVRKVILSKGFAALRYRFENMDALPGPRVLSPSLVRDIGRRDALSWRHVDIIRKRWKGNLVIKGIMSDDDAATANSAGVDGIIVSNHGGRQIDCAVSSLEALERIADRDLVLKVMYDGGIRRGADVLKALKVGACFVFIGRPMVLAAAAAGAEGVTHAIDLLAREIDLNMALLGINNFDDLSGINMSKYAGFKEISA